MSRKIYSDNSILAEFRQGFDDYDAWSCTMEAWFAIAESMVRNAETVPASWEFRPSPMLAGKTDVEWSEDYGPIAETVLVATPGERLQAGRVLTMYAAILRHD